MHFAESLCLFRKGEPFGGNLWLRREGATMNHPLVVSLIFTTGLALGVLLMPVFPELGGALIFVACSVVLILWVRRSSR
jgi:hypothetical protein